MCSIKDIPNEIIYKIFDKLDINSIISFCLTCKNYYSYINSYNKYDINLKSISKSKFDSILKLIKAKNIRSLILSDDDETPGQIKYFIENYQINQLINLKSLKLIQINENDLENIYENFSLNFFSIEFRKYFTVLNSKTFEILNKILHLNYLKELHFDMRSYENNSMLWTNKTNIEYLFLFNLNLNQFIQIINKSNNYKMINLKNIQMNYSNEIKFINLNKLIRFEIEQSDLIIQNIIYLISFMPNLIHLKLEGYTNDLLQMNFIQNFQFFFHLPLRNLNINSFIQQYNNFNYNLIKTSNEIYFYSLPLINNSFNYSSQLNIISSSVYHIDLNIRNFKVNIHFLFKLDIEQLYLIRLYNRLRVTLYLYIYFEIINYLLVYTDLLMKSKQIKIFF